MLTKSATKSKKWVFNNNKKLQLYLKNVFLQKTKTTTKSKNWVFTTTTKTPNAFVLPKV